MPVLTREDLRNQLRKREIAPVYALYGKETYLRDLAAKTIVDFSFAEGEFRDFNEAVISLNAFDVEDALAAADQLPMMASKRVVTVANVCVTASTQKENLKEASAEKLERYLKNPSPSTVLIFLIDELDKRRKAGKILLENSASVEFKHLSDEELVRWAQDEFRKENVNVDTQAARFLVTLVGNQLRRLQNEVKKLVTASLPERVVTIELIEQLVTNSRELSNFELTDHLLTRNKPKALITLKKILDDGAEPVMLVGLLAANFRKIFMAKEMMERERAPRTDVAKIVRVPYSNQQIFFEMARKTTAQKLIEITKRIAACDKALKSGLGAGNGSKVQLEMLVCELLTI